jgi:hypothetical protein
VTSYTTTARNKVVDSLGINGGHDWYSMHTADPGTTGANELAGSARKSGPFPAASGGEATNSGTTHDIPAGSTITHYGRWSASSGGTFLMGGPLPASEVYGVAGQYNLTHKIQQGAS